VGSVRASVLSGRTRASVDNQVLVCECLSVGLRKLPSIGRGVGASERQSNCVTFSFQILCLPYGLPLGPSSLLRHHIPTLRTDYDSLLPIVTHY
jgi:hypothetical protein